MLILGIDTTCDDTSAGVVKNGSHVWSNVIASQHKVHARFGGIVPMIAAREHTRQINLIIAAALDEAGITFHDIDAVAVSNHQGLLLSLVVGVSAAKSIALALDVPLIGMHHLEGHVYSNIMGRENELPFPFLCLTVAGGHTLLLRVDGHGRYHLLGHTRDDAAGEAYDKIARRLSLGYPGGPIVEKLARNGNPFAYDFPRPMIDKAHFEFSFSGLKTAVVRVIEAAEKAGESLSTEDLCASFQQAIVDVLVTKTIRVAEKEGLSRIALAGGVAMNRQLRRDLQQAANAKGLRTFAPPPDLCIDNGAMIAGAAWYLLHHRGPSPLTIDVLANAPLGELGLKYRPASKYAGYDTAR